MWNGALPLMGTTTDQVDSGAQHSNRQTCRLTYSASRNQSPVLSRCLAGRQGGVDDRQDWQIDVDCLWRLSEDVGRWTTEI